MSVSYCVNCGTPVTGNFCGACGTAAHAQGEDPIPSNPVPPPSMISTPLEDVFSSTPGGHAAHVSATATGLVSSYPALASGAAPPSAWAPWAYSLIIGIGVLIGLLAMTATGSARTTLDGLDQLLTLPTIVFVVIFGFWDSRKVVKHAGGPSLVVPAILIPPVYLFMRQRRLKHTQAPAFVYLVLLLLYLLIAFASTGSSLGGLTGRLSCTDLVGESVRISEENATALQPKLVSVSDPQVVTDNQGKKMAGSRNTQLICTGSGYYSDTQTAPTRMEYWTDSSGAGFIEYQAQ